MFHKSRVICWLVFTRVVLVFHPFYMWSLYLYNKFENADLHEFYEDGPIILTWGIL